MIMSEPDFITLDKSMNFKDEKERFANVEQPLLSH